MSDSRLVHGTLFLKAFSLLFSWNALMGTCHFFASKSGSTSPFVFDYLIMIFVSIRFLLLFVSNYLLTLISPFSLVLISSFGTVFCFLSLFLMSIYEISSTSLFILLSAVVVGLSSFFALTAYLGVFRFISDLPSTSYVRMMSIGFGVASVLTSAMRLGSVLLFPPIPGSSSNSDAAFYFVLAVLICSIATYLFYRMRTSVERLSATKKNISLSNINNNGNSFSSTATNTNVKPSLPVKFLLARVWWNLFCLFAVSLQIAFVTPSLFYLTASSSNYENILFSERVFPLFCLFLSSIADFGGRLALKLKTISNIPTGIWSALTIIRFLLIGVFLLGNIHPILKGPNVHFSLISSLYSSDAIYFMLVSLLGFTGGAISTIMLMTIPSSFESTFDRKRITTWMVGIQSFGFLCGTFLSFAMKSLLYSSIITVV